MAQDEDLFANTAVLIGLNAELMKKVAATDEKTRKAIDDQQARHDALLKAVKTLSNELRQMYAPEQVKAAAEASKAAVVNFEARTGEIYENIKRESSRVSSDFWFRSLGAAIIGTGVVIAAFVFLAWYTPDIQELKARRAEWERVNIPVSHRDGKTWAKVDPFALEEKPICTSKTDCWVRLR